MFRFQHAAMATQYEIRCVHPDPEYARQAARAAFEVVDRLELQLSRFVENSDISRINGLAAGEATIVGLETMECLRLSAAIHAKTSGAFDISVGTGFAHLEILPAEFVVRAHAPVSLDLGAIGKGYGVDRVAEVLEDWEVDRALIDSGYSSVLALEPPEGEAGWPLTLSLPGEGETEVFSHLSARQMALGASGIRKGDHIKDPRDGTPARSRPGAWVSAPRAILREISRQAGAGDSAAAVADALSTAFMILSIEEIEAVCQAHPGLEAWVVGDRVVHFPASGRTDGDSTNGD